MDCAVKEWHKTTYGVGHHHRPGYYFPDATFRRMMDQPLPASLRKQDEVPKEEYFITTNQEKHDPKYPHTLNGNVKHEKAPGHWKVHFLKDTCEKLENPGFRRPLSPSNQQSETQEEYTSKRPFILPDTLRVSRSIRKPGYETNEAVRRRDPSFMQTNENILNPIIVKELDPYTSQTQAAHHPFGDDEYFYAKQPLAYPHYTPTDRFIAPRQLPMRDEMIFKSETRIGPVLRRPPFVPHTGLTSEFQHQFVWPTHPNNKFNQLALVHSPWCGIENRTTAPKPPPSAKSAYVHPYMYDTEYNNIGRRKPVTISAK